jgi:hypothetical protein
MSPPRARWNAPAISFYVVTALAALVFRFALLPFSTKFGEPGDHDDFVRWGMQATDEGLLTLYDKPPARHPWQMWYEGQWLRGQREFDRVCNYPPLSAYLLYASGLVFRLVSQDRLINTVVSHACFSCWSILADLVLAAGCAAIVSHLRGARAARWTWLVALFFPPFWWDSVVWAQMDTVLLAPVVWMLYFMLRQRWACAGFLWGVAFGLKPQAILFIPLWGYALFAERPRGRVILGGLVAAGTIGAIALPFMLHSGLAWLRLSYLQNVGGEYADQITLKAFNIWYVDLLRTDSLDAFARWGPLTKSGWGKVFLLAGMLAGFVAGLWRWRGDRRALLFWAALSLLLFMMLPTEVHERYLLLVLPFVGVATAVSRRFWPGFMLLSVVTMAQLTWPSWMKEEPGSWPDIQALLVERYQRERGVSGAWSRPSLEEWLADARAEYRTRRQQTVPYEWALTVLSLTGAVCAAAACFTVKVEAVQPGAAPRAD